MSFEEVRIGDCRLIRGDALEVLPTLEPVGALVTDPPYGIAWNDKGRIGRPSAVATAGGVYGRDWGIMIGDEVDFDPTPLLALHVPSVIWGANYYASRLP